jgi:hypothetical protein
VSTSASQGDPLRGVAGPRRPAGLALAWAPARPRRQVPRGGEPTHVRADLGKDDLGCPHPDPGDRVEDHQLTRPGLDHLGDPLRQRSDVGLQRFDMRQHAGQQVRMMLTEPGRQRLPQLRQLRPQPGLGQIGQQLRVGHPGDQGVHHLPPRHTHHVGGYRGQLDPGVLEDLMQPVHLAGARSDQRLAIPGQVPQLPKRPRGTKLGRNSP